MDFEKATLRKATVSTLPLWAEQEQDPVASPSSSSSSSSPSSGIRPPPTSHLPSTSGTQPSNGTIASNIASSSSSNGGPSLSPFASPLKTHLKNQSSTSHGHPQQDWSDWSIFATMSNVSTLSSLPHRNNAPLRKDASSDSIIPTTSLGHGGPNAVTNPQKLPTRLDNIFNAKSTGNVPRDSIESTDNVCTCTCALHNRVGGEARLHLSPSKRRNQKETREASRGYLTGHCDSTTAPDQTTWDEKDAETPLTHHHNKYTIKNTAFDLEAMKAFLNSPLFSNILKSLTIITSISLFAIALDSLVLVKHSPDQQTQLTNGNAALIITITLSILTIAYSCITIFLELRRPPEGLDSSNSKPLIVIISEIIASIVWSQVFSVAIYIYIWTFGCTDASEYQIDLLHLNDPRLTHKLCRRQGAMVGLELLLVVLLIFNFYTHLAQNFKFIRAVS